MAKLTISLAQMQIELGDVRKNLARMERLAVEAGRRGSHLVLFPELWSTGYDLANAKEHASQLNSGMFAQISQIATQNKIAVAGSILEQRGVEVTNSASFFAPNGRMMGVYRKMHLFRLMEEDQYLAPGSSPLVIDLPWGSTGMAICYDLRFPELFRHCVVEQDAIMMLVMAEWPLARIEHFRALVIARAIENQCYMVVTNAAGETGDTVFGGHSMIVDPWGRIVIEGGETPMLLTAEIELDEIQEVRETIPVFKDIRKDIFDF